MAELPSTVHIPLLAVPEPACRKALTELALQIQSLYTMVNLLGDAVEILIDTRYPESTSKADADVHEKGEPKNRPSARESE